MRVLVQNAELPHKQEWFDLPMSMPHKNTEDIYRLIGVARKPDGYLSAIVIADVESSVVNLKSHISPNTSLENLDKLCVQLSKMSEKEKEQLSEKINTQTIDDVIALAKEITAHTKAFSMIGGM
ncbi:MAG: hypothetical protein VB047_06900 [Anaerotignum propionicum]|uniref:hypothetical protein n=1 Tax=Anaerotignum propionicum TaxID=28446 RepID=UPI002B21FD74|nr:hypothetical protein [Anaerotignum propionicum]MEA5057270.1 hypothetical protein [Anaerotignum propionicum]